MGKGFKANIEVAYGEDFRPLLQRSRWIALTAGILFLVVTLSLFWPQPLVPERLVTSLAARDYSVVDGYLHPSQADLRHALRIDTFLLWCLLLAAAGVYLGRERLLRPESGHRIFSFAMTSACSIAVCVSLAQPGVESVFCPVDTLMSHPASLPVYGQRLLVVWLADAIHLVRPALSPRRCYLATQFISAWAAVYMIGKWSAIFIGKQWKFLGQLLLVAMLAPTFIYCTFYDIPLVFFYALCLLLLHRRSFIGFIAVLGLATLNHETTLLLIPVAALALFRVEPPGIALGVPLAALAAWFAARSLIQHLVPIPSHFQPHLWSNLIPLAHPTGDLIKSLCSLGFWWIAAALGFSHSIRLVKAGAIVLPGLIAITLVAGHFSEARQFDAFIPVAIAMILSYLRARLESPSRMNAEPAAAAAR